MTETNHSNFELWRIEFERERAERRAELDRRLSSLDTQQAVLTTRLESDSARIDKCVTKTEFAPIHWTFLVIGGSILTAVIGSLLRRFSLI